jgi:hypothetical protein
VLKRIARWSPKGVDLAVSTQTFGEESGITDIEISGNSDLHLVVEAKRGWALPSESQLHLYAKRLKKTARPFKSNVLVTASECSRTYAKLVLPKKVKGIPVRHISWSEILDICRRSRAKSSLHQEKSWLDQFGDYLRGIASMQDVQSNWVYVVSLSTSEIRKGSGYTWIDVIQKDRSYFHPVGNTWPTTPPNYIAFRYHGRLQSIHHIESYKVCNRPRDENKNWTATKKPHFIYSLGRPIRPPLDLSLGKLWSNARVWCLIDTLLTGKYKTVKEAQEASKKRVEHASTD